jgi:hypothetical protein
MIRSHTFEVGPFEITAAGEDGVSLEPLDKWASPLTRACHAILAEAAGDGKLDKALAQAIEEDER